ncbi:hypothetical protein PEBR_26298 [Penicillium brasilianum]|uniref:Uncharacterized protein n=1 Tax=Penicillium brasilianum TaxID=104259 RepID=A0A1S9RIV4_PENBI|nr:hypothetical protein PEBR_26298 [Penicillium brasilianum]
MALNKSCKLRKRICKWPHKVKQVARDLHHRIVGPRTKDIPLSDLFDANIRWPLPETNKLPLWKRHGRPEMPPIIIPEEWNRRPSSNMRVSNLLLSLGSHA